MKTKLSLSVVLLGGLFLFSQAAMATVFTVSAAVPAAAGVSITVNSVTGTTYTLQGGTALAYGALTYNTTNSVYLAPNFFTFDIANLGAGSPDTTLSYGTETKPVGATSSLGGNSGIVFDKEVYTTSSTPPTQTQIGSAVLLSSLSGTNIPSSQTAGGWLRVYMGLCTGNLTTANGSVDPAGCHPFGASDAVGSYTGQLTVTATTT